MSSHKGLTTFILIAAGGFTYHVVKRSIPRKKRRAKKASNGARLEVVVVAGSPSEPLVRSISLDLERRGFIVYIVCNTIEEEILVANGSRQDIKPLMIDIVDVCIPRVIALHTSNRSSSPRVLKPQSKGLQRICKFLMQHFEERSHTT